MSDNWMVNWRINHSDSDEFHEDQPELAALAPNDPRYPTRVVKTMGERTPKRIYLAGNIKLLTKPAIGFTGSRKPSPKGLALAQNCAKEAASQKLTLVSGGASGIDTAAHIACLDMMGTTIIVLPDGISSFRIKKELDVVWDWNRVLVISQFPPEAPWVAWRAMARNELVVALSDSVIAFEPGDTGGTFDAGQKALKAGVSLFVGGTRRAGTQMLLDKGANPLTIVGGIGTHQ